MKKKIVLSCLSFIMSLSLVTTKVFGANNVTQFNIGTYRSEFIREWASVTIPIAEYDIPLPYSKSTVQTIQVELDSYYATGTVTINFNNNNSNLAKLQLCNIYVYGADIFSYNNVTGVLKINIEDIRYFEVVLVCDGLTSGLVSLIPFTISGSGTAMSTPNEIKSSIDYITAGKTVSLSNIKTAIEALNVIDNNIMGANSKTLSDLYSQLVNCYNCLHGTYDGDSKTVTDLLDGIDKELTDIVWDVNDIKDFLATDTSNYYESVTTFLNNFDVNNFKTKLNNISSKMDSLVTAVNNIDNLIDTISWQNSNFEFLGYTIDNGSSYSTTQGRITNGTYAFNLRATGMNGCMLKLSLNVYPYSFNLDNIIIKTSGGIDLKPHLSYYQYSRLGIYLYFDINHITNNFWSDQTIQITIPDSYFYTSTVTTQNRIQYLTSNDIEYWTLLSVFTEYNMSDNIEELCNYSSQALNALEVLKTNTANTVTSLNEIKALIQSLMPLNNSIDIISWNKIADFVKWDTQQGNSGTATASNLPSGTKYEFTAITNRTLNTGLFKLHLTVSASQLDSSTFKVYALANNTYNLTNPTIYYIQKGRVWTDVYFDFTDSWSSNPDGYQKIVIQLNVTSAFFSGYSDSALYFLSSDNIDYWDIMQVLIFKQMMSVTSSDSDYDTRIYPLLNDGTSESNTAKTSLASMVASLTEKNNAVEGAINTRETQYLTEMETFESLIHSDLGDIAEVTVTATWLKTKLESLYNDLDLWRLTISTPLNLALLGSIIGIRKRDEEK